MQKIAAGKLLDHCKGMNRHCNLFIVVNDLHRLATAHQGMLHMPTRNWAHTLQIYPLVLENKVPKQKVFIHHYSTVLVSINKAHEVIYQFLSQNPMPLGIATYGCRICVLYNAFLKNNTPYIHLQYKMVLSKYEVYKH